MKMGAAIARLGTMRFRHGQWVRSVAFAPDGQSFASGSADSTALVWDLYATMAPRQLTVGGTVRLWHELASPDATRAFFGDLCQQFGLVPRHLPGGSGLPSPDAVANMFGAAGFSLRPPVQDSVTVVFDSEASWWRWVWSHGQRGFLEQLADDRVDEFKDAAFSALRSFTTPSGIPLEQQFLVLKATV